MYGGRLDLGIGAGGAPTCHAMTGTPMWAGAERQDRLAEFVEMVDRLLVNERASYAGTFYSAEDVLMRPRPLQQPRPPLVVAEHGPRSMKVAARFADTWSIFEPGAGLTGAEAAAAFRKMNAYVDAQAREAGRDPASITRSLCCGYSPSSTWDSLDEALEGIRMFEAAGVNEFILSYAPGPDAPASDAPTDAIAVNRLIRDEADLARFAAALLR